MDDKTCPFPGCGAGLILQEVKDANSEYRGEIKDQLGLISNAIKSLESLMRETMKSNGIVEQAIVYLRKADERNEKAHTILFDDLRLFRATLISIKDEAARDRDDIRKEFTEKLDDKYKELTNKTERDIAVLEKRLDGTVTIKAVTLMVGVVAVVLSILTIVLNIVL